MVHYLTFDDVGITVAVVGIALAFVVLVWNAVKAIHDWRQLARRPTTDRIDDHEKRIARLEECCEEVHGKLDNDWEFRQDETEINKLMLRSIKQLLQHEIDGNDKASLVQMEAEIDNWLFDHAK